MESQKAPYIAELDKFKAKYMPFLKEAKKKFFIALYVFIISSFIGLFGYEKILKLLVSLFSLEKANIVFTSPFQFINLSISCGLAVGIITTTPLIIYQLISFLKPALKRDEFKIITRVFPYAISLFLSGFIFGALIMKWQIDIAVSRSVSLGIGNVFDISRLLSNVLITSALMGVGFLFPIFLLIAIKIGLINQEQLIIKRPFIYLGSFIFALFLPPDSIIADIFLALPLIILFESTLLVSRSIHWRPKSKE